MKTKNECAHCGEEVDFESTGSSVYDKAGNYEDVCNDCYHQHVEDCQLCGDEVMPHQVSSFIVVKVELGECGHPHALPGIYRVRSRPFLSVPMIGSPSLHSDDLLFVAVLPRPDAEFEISGHTCEKCARRYDAIYWQAYANAFADDKIKRRRYGVKRGWFPIEAAQRRRIAAAFREHPERLMDLECDPDDFAEDFGGNFSLPKAKTYHDFVLMRHRGVTIYRSYPEQKDFSWLLLRPEPRFRGMSVGSDYHNGQKLDGSVLFCASGLPTYQSPEPDKGCDHYVSSYRENLAQRQAVLDAIDQGLLRQDGAFDRDGKPLLCR